MALTLGNLGRLRSLVRRRRGFLWVLAGSCELLWVLVGSCELLWERVGLAKKSPLEPIRTYQNPSPPRKKNRPEPISSDLFLVSQAYSLRYLSSQLKNSRFHTTLFCGWNTWCASFSNDTKRASIPCTRAAVKASSDWL